MVRPCEPKPIIHVVIHSDFWSSGNSTPYITLAASRCTLTIPAMLLLSFLYLGSLAAASPTSGPWSRMNLFGFNAEQLPLPSVPELVKDTPLEGLFPDERHHHEGTIWEIISNDSKYDVSPFPKRPTSSSPTYNRFSKLTKAIEFADAAHYFDDEDSQ